ncbi:hypothetical protein N9L50_05080 [Flavobacteriaceae bacterium]|nr:hypothetical protein [Flavobacteriaceae bacterium]
MKKGLLSILASALLVVGCQNYDDQFTLLENQITALTQTVSGLSQVQSTLASLSGTVTSLSSTVTGLGDAIDTAVAEGLADIQEDITAIEAAVADVASSEEVSELSDAVAASQEDLDELLANSSVFQGDVVVNSQSTLDAYLAMGSALSIVNGDVTITVSTAMDQEGVQTLVDNILTIVGNLTYTSGDADIAETTFNNLSGVQSITITQGGGMRFPNLASAAVIRLNDNFETGSNPVDVIHFGSLTTVTSFQTDTDADTIEFLKATELHLTSLPRYGAALTLKIDEGGTLLIPVLASVDADGDESTLDLTVEGASSLDFSLITDGDISATDVAAVTGGADHDGTIALNGVTKAVIPNFTRGLTITGTSDLEYLHVIGATPNVQTGATAVTTTPNLDLTDQTDLETVIIDGTLGAIKLSGNSKLTDVTLTAVSESVVVTTASDLTTLTIAGNTKSISVTSNSDLETLVITSELNTAKGNAAAVSTSGSLVVTGNTDLTSLTSSFDPIKTLTITGNTDLATLDFTGTALVGAAADLATVSIGSSSAKSNALVAANITDSYAATETGIGAGSISDESGLSTLKTYLDAAIAAKSATGVKVFLDEITKYTIKQAPGTDDTEYDDIVHGGAQAAKLAIVNVVPADVTEGDDAVAGQNAWLADLSLTAATIINHIGDNGVTTSIFNADLNVNPSLAIDQIEDVDVQNAADAVGITLAAYAGGNPGTTIEFKASGATATGSEVTPGVASTTHVGQDDMLAITIGNFTATATVGSLTAPGNATITSEDALADAVLAIWTARWRTVSSTATYWNIATPATNILTISNKSGSGSRGHNETVSVSVTQGTDTSTVPFIATLIGDTKATSDNKTLGDDLIITALADNAGTILGQHDNIFVSGAVTTLTSTLFTVAEAATETATDIFEDEAREDVINDEDGTADVTNATASTTDYTAWIGV